MSESPSPLPTWLSLTIIGGFLVFLGLTLYFGFVAVDKILDSVFGWR